MKSSGGLFWAKGSIGVALLLGLALVSTAMPARADTYGFTCLTSTSPTDCATGQSQLTVVVSDAGNGQVSFTFSNSGPNASSITDVYFDDGTLLAIASIVNGPGVSFSQGAAPSDLPGGQLASPPFHTTAGFLADSDAPVQINGVNPGESEQGSQRVNDAATLYKAKKKSSRSSRP